MSPPSHIALIGCGFTGTSAFFQLVDKHPVDEVSIFEASGDFGPGYPYRTGECQDYLINNTTDSMCLVPSNRRAFFEWLQGRPDLAPDLDSRGHLPRALFGEFLKDMVASSRTAAEAKGIKVNLVPEEVTVLEEKGGGQVAVSWAGGEVLADAAILTTGRCPDLDLCPPPPQGAPARYIGSHIMSSGLDHVPLDATVHVLGASLSAYDVVNRLFSVRSGCRFQRSADGRLSFVAGPNQRRVVLCSRSGRLKAMQTRHPMKIARRHFTPEGLRAAAAGGALQLADVAQIIGQEAESHGADVNWESLRDPYRDCVSSSQVDDRAAQCLEAAIDGAAGREGGNFLVDLFADAQVDIWDAFAERLLAPEAERTYRDKFETATLCYAAPAPVSTAEKVLALHRAGRLSVLKGVRRVTLCDDAAAYEILHDFGTEAARVLVNTTGTVDRQVTSPGQSTLVRSLAARGLLRGYVRDGVTMKGAAIDPKTFRAEGARNIYVANMLLWGPGFFTSSAFMMATVIERLLAELFGQP